MGDAVTRAPRWVAVLFRGAALYGAAALTLSAFVPPTEPAALLPHYAFVGTALAFQIVFWLVGGDPVRHRTFMLAGMAEKLAFGVPALLIGPTAAMPFALVDLALGAGFLAAWRATPLR